MTDKRQQWETIKTQAPELADWLSSLTKRFGKPSATYIELLESGELIESGVFKAPHPCLEPGKRKYY